MLRSWENVSKAHVLYVAVDNLAAHSVAGFFESFAVDRICRFYMVTKSEIRDKEVYSGTFKQFIRNAHNFRNVALTLAVKHQKIMAYNLDTSSFFKPSVEMDKVNTASIASYPENVRQIFCQRVPQLPTVIVVS